MEKTFLESLFDLSFTSFITTKIVKVLFLLCVVAAGLFGLSIIGKGFASKSLVGIVGSLIVAPVVFFLVVMYVRVGLETLLVVFRIAENTQKLADDKTDG